jgi:hypothetical protein
VCNYYKLVMKYNILVTKYYVLVMKYIILVAKYYILVMKYNILVLTVTFRWFAAYNRIHSSGR